MTIVKRFYNSFHKNTLLILNANYFQDACPARCKSCKGGGSNDGGMPVNSDGVCEYFCSKYGYCGNTTKYKTGVDCSECRGSGNI